MPGKGTGRRLLKAQREAILEWLAAGLQTGEINERAAAFDPPFVMTATGLHHYRRKYGIRIKELQAASDLAAMNTGTAVKERRVELLKTLAEKLTKELLEEDKLWVDQVKGIGRGEDYERIEYKEFNAAEVAQLRGLLDDLAKEKGDRATKAELTGPGGLPLDTIVRIYIPDNGRPDTSTGS